MSRIFESGGQIIGTSVSASVLPMNIQGLISFRIKIHLGLVGNLGRIWGLLPGLPVP